MMKKILIILLTFLMILLLTNAGSLCVFATESDTSVSDSSGSPSADVSDASDNSAVISSLDDLTDTQQLIFLLSVVIGLLIGQAFAFWKW